jgi:hypothetical protein
MVRVGPPCLTAGPLSVGLLPIGGHIQPIGGHIREDPFGNWEKIQEGDVTYCARGPGGPRGCGPARPNPPGRRHLRARSRFRTPPRPCPSLPAECRPPRAPTRGSPPPEALRARTPLAKPGGAGAWARPHTQEADADPAPALDTPPEALGCPLPALQPRKAIPTPLSPQRPAGGKSGLGGARTPAHAHRRLWPSARAIAPAQAPARARMKKPPAPRRVRGVRRVVGTAVA